MKGIFISGSALIATFSLLTLLITTYEYMHMFIYFCVRHYVTLNKGVCKTVEGFQHSGVILSTLGLFSKVGVFITVGGYCIVDIILTTVRIFSTVKGYHVCGGVQYRGSIISTVGDSIQWRFLSTVQGNHDI